MRMVLTILQSVSLPKDILNTVSDAIYISSAITLNAGSIALCSTAKLEQFEDN